MPKDRVVREVNLPPQDSVTADVFQNSVGVLDHGELVGLSDDDHEQYLDEDRHAELDAADHTPNPLAEEGDVLTVTVEGYDAEADWVSLCHVGLAAPLTVYKGRLWLDTTP